MLQNDSSNLTDQIDFNRGFDIKNSTVIKDFNQQNEHMSPFFADQVNWNSLAGHILKTQAEPPLGYFQPFTQAFCQKKPQIIQRRKKKTNSLYYNFRLGRDLDNIDDDVDQAQLLNISCYCSLCGRKVQKHKLFYKRYFQVQTCTSIKFSKSIPKVNKLKKNQMILNSILPKIRRRENVCLPIEFLAEPEDRKRVETIKFSGQMKIFHRFLVGLCHNQNLKFDQTPQVPKTPSSNKNLSSMIPQQDFINPPIFGSVEPGNRSRLTSRQESFTNRVGVIRKSIFSIYDRQTTKQQSIKSGNYFQKQESLDISYHTKQLSPILAKNKLMQIIDNSKRIKTEIAKISSLSPLHELLKKGKLQDQKLQKGIKSSKIKLSNSEITKKRIISLYQKQKSWALFQNAHSNFQKKQAPKCSLECQSERAKISSTKYSLHK